MSNRQYDQIQDNAAENEARRRRVPVDSYSGAHIERETREKGKQWDAESVKLLRRQQRRFAAQPHDW